MERIVYRLALDTQKGGVQKTLQGFIVGDQMSRRIEVQLVARGESVTIDPGVKTMMYVTKEGASTPSINECFVSNNKIIYDVLPTDTDVAGITRMQIKILSNTEILMSPIFELEVGVSDADDEESSTMPTFTVLEAALLQAQAVYDGRLESIEITDDLYFRANYGDGTTYESDAFQKVYETENARVVAEQLRVEAENLRVTAETGRVARYEAFMTEANAKMTEYDNAVNERITVADELIEEMSYVIGGNHAGDTNNPHKVTAAQVGARPDTWMPTASDVGAATAADHNIYTYSNLNQLGLTVGSETIDDIVAKLPNSSELLITVGTANNVSIYPNSYGSLHVIKTSDSRTRFNFYSKGDLKWYCGYYDASISSAPWSGWDLQFSKDKPPTASDVGALPLTGGTLSGGLLNLNNGTARWSANADQMWLMSYNDANNFRSLYLNSPNKSGWEKALEMYGKTGGTEYTRTVYHTGNITNGTSALTASSSSLATGNIYLQYE